MKKAQLNLIDKAVAFLNPEGAVNRIIARQKLVNFSYDAVKYSRERKGPSALSGAEDYHSNYDRVELMKRARDLAENVGLVRSILMKFASHTAANISYQARTENPEVNTEVEAYWAEWWDKCDISTRHTGSTLMQVAMMSMLRDGDFLFVLVRDKDGNLKIQGIEADRLGDPFKVYTSLDLIGGIHIDRDTGSPTAYDIYNRSIGDFYTYQATISASQAFHLFDPLRIDQYRGVSAFHTAINDATDIHDIVNFEKLAAKVASSQSAVVRRNNNNASDLSSLTTDENVNGDTIKLEAIESGKISYLEPGEDIVFPDGPSRPSGAFAEFHKILLRNICLGVGIPYSFAVDPSAMSGPTARLEMQQAGRTFRRYQKLLDDKVLRPIKNIVIADAVARGLIENNSGSRTTKGIFNFGANVSIDLGRESASAISEFKTGLRTAADIYAERGQDFESAMRQRAIEAKLVKDLAGEYEVSADTISDIAMQGLQRETQVQTAQKPTDQPQGQEGDADMLGGASLNGAQVSSLINIINAVAIGAVSKEGAISIITAAFPTISPDQARAIIAGVNIGTTIPTTKEEKQQATKDEGGDASGGSTPPPQPSPDQPTPTGGGNSLKKNELEELDCGTGSGGFQPGNSCAGGGGIQSSIRDATPSGFGPSTSSQEKTKEQRMRGESIDDAINRKVGYQVDNGSVKINEDKGGWVVSVAQPEGNPRKFRSSSRQQAINQAYEELYPDTELIPHPSDSGAKPQKKSNLEILESLDCGTGSGGFKEGNTCAGGGDGNFGDFTNMLSGDVKIDEKTIQKISEKSGYSTAVAKTPEKPKGRRASEVKSEEVAVLIYDNKIVGAFQGDTVSIKPEHRGKGLSKYLYERREQIGPLQSSNFSPAGKAARRSYTKWKQNKSLSKLTYSDMKMLIEGMMGGIELGKYEGIDFTPPQGARDAAKRALEVRETKPPSQRGMTPVGIARARDLQNGVKMSPDTIKRMKAFFDRHEVDKKGSTFGEQGKGWQAWNGWGGDAGYSWAKKIVGQMDARDNKELARPVSQTPAPPKERIKGSKENPEGTASTRSKAGDIEISEQNEEALKNKIAEFKDKYPSRKAPSLGALKKVFRRGAGAFSTSFRPTITGGKPNSRNAWAMARVNKFLKMAGGGEVKESYRKADGDLL